jgi:hypothetical protein
MIFNRYGMRLACKTAAFAQIGYRAANPTTKGEP